jgi:hypothetical protein
MTLVDYYFADSRLFLIPIEHLTPSGMSREFAAELCARGAWSAAHGELFDRSFALYWSRSLALATRTRSWMPPRVRHVAVVTNEQGVRPYAQLLNTSAWTVYKTDFDPPSGHPEFGAYVLAQGDRMALTGEVTLSALHNAVWWLERTDAECDAFAAAAARSARPDATGYHAIAAALPWLRRLRHETLAPPLATSPHRVIPGTGILVPQALEGEPRGLVDAWATAAKRTIDLYRASWQAAPDRVLGDLSDWLRHDAPPLLVTAERGRMLWDRGHPERLGSLRSALKRGDAAAVAAVGEDLRTVARHTEAFLSALTCPDALPMPAAETEQGGYTYMHRERRLIAYDIDEPGMERLSGPPLPYARAMLGARTIHEWAHLAVDAGWVPCVVGDAELATRRARFASALGDVIAELPPPVRALTAGDLAALGAERPAGEALAPMFLARMSDYQANLLAQRFLDRDEIETYIRHNIRTLRFGYAPPQLFRMLIRYLFELQYLGFSLVADAKTFLVRSTWFDTDFFATRVLDPKRFAELAARAAVLCACYAVDETRFSGRR